MAEKIGDVQIDVIESLSFEGDIELVIREASTMGHRFTDLRLRDVRTGQLGNGITLPSDRLEELRKALKKVEES